MAQGFGSGTISRTISKMSVDKTDLRAVTPWRRVPFVWLLIGIPVSSVILGAAMFILAVHSDDGLVVDDYYQRGKHINQILARDDAARDYHLCARLVFDVQTGVLRADLSGEKASQIEELACSLIHPTRSGYDQALSLRRCPDGRLHGDFAPLRQARWIAQLEISQWRLVGNLNLNWSPTLELLPQDPGPGS